ncbi:PTA1A [Auxenochlorella protothecoides x Auxenochlorella symbiontica]
MVPPNPEPVPCTGTGRDTAAPIPVATLTSQDLAEATEDAAHEEGRSDNVCKRFLRWVLSFAVPGLGMYSEAYFVFAIGNLKPIFKALYPECWVTFQTCSPNLSDSINYSQISGIIAGQLIIGFLADRLGRRAGSILTASIMLLFGILITASSGSNSGNLFIMFTVVQALFGVGLGGEFPVASASANERAEQTKHLQNKRGETVVLVFSMQGWGNLFNTMIILACMAGFGQYAPPYSPYALEVTWRLSYALGLPPLLFIFYYRVFRLRESTVWRQKRESLKLMGRDAQWTPRKTRLLLRHYWHRLVGTSLSWFVWDFAYYGNKLFQSTFIEVIHPGAGLLAVLEWTLLNSGVALVGLYCAAFTIDKTWMGRKRMQAMGFWWMCVLFLACAGAYHKLLEPANLPVFQFLYYFSSFWGQFGPNATTWLLPAETIPTEARSMCHGIAAAVGKVGALLAGVVFSLVDDRSKFWISGVCSAAGVLLTFLLVPNLTGLDLKEGDKRWLAIVDGKADEYTGPAIAAKHLSLLERTVYRHQARYVSPLMEMVQAPGGEKAAGGPPGMA